MASGSRGELIRITRAITLQGRSSAWPQAVATFRDVQRDGLRPDQVLFGATVSAVARGSRWDLALSLLTEMRGQSLSPTTAALSAAATACGRAARWQQSLLILQDLPRLDLVALSAGIDACGRGFAWERALGFLEQAHHLSVKLDLSALNAAAIACVRGSHWPQALVILGEAAPKHGLVLDVVSFGTAISACERGARWELARYLLGEMERRNLRPNAACFGAAVAACEKASEWQAALALLPASPSSAALGAAASACASAGQWERSLELLEFVRRRSGSSSPDVAAIGATVVACERAAAWVAALKLLLGAGNLDAAGLVMGARCARASLVPFHEAVLLRQVARRFADCALSGKASQEALAEQECAATAIREAETVDSAPRLCSLLAFQRAVADPVGKRLSRLSLSRSPPPQGATRLHDSLLASATDLGPLYTRDVAGDQGLTEANSASNLISWRRPAARALALGLSAQSTPPWGGGGAGVVASRPLARQLLVWLDVDDLRVHGAAVGFLSGNNLVGAGWSGS
ncbi:unnamed protein product, partial [Polarella glacialis]